MACSDRHPDSTARYCIDRIDNLEVIDDSEISDSAISLTASVSEFTEQVFKMYGGSQGFVVLQFDKSLVEPIFDQFGEDTQMMSVDKTTCVASVQVRVSPTFFCGIVRFGRKMKVLSPYNEARSYHEHIRSVLERVSGRKTLKVWEC